MIKKPRDFAALSAAKSLRGLNSYGAWLINGSRILTAIASFVKQIETAVKIKIDRRHNNSCCTDKPTVLLHAVASTDLLPM
jgi:hypothetical protein